MGSWRGSATGSCKGCSTCSCGGIAKSSRWLCCLLGMMSCSTVLKFMVSALGGVVSLAAGSAVGVPSCTGAAPGAISLAAGAAPNTPCCTAPWPSCTEASTRERLLLRVCLSGVRGSSERGIPGALTRDASYMSASGVLCCAINTRSGVVGREPGATNTVASGKLCVLRCVVEASLSTLGWASSGSAREPDRSCAIARAPAGNDAAGGSAVADAPALSLCTTIARSGGDGGGDGGVNCKGAAAVTQGGGGEDGCCTGRSTRTSGEAALPARGVAPSCLETR
mmetsp:Transcript_52022/g.131489  ORF Transcript_52022/g.131489 Transcript_52022/m.131489 type:complete len:281 (-) Transcript_52022:109-951(-)